MTPEYQALIVAIISGLGGPAILLLLKAAIERAGGQGAARIADDATIRGELRSDLKAARDALDNCLSDRIALQGRVQLLEFELMKARRDGDHRADGLAVRQLSECETVEMLDSALLRRQMASAGDSELQDVG